MRRVVLDTNVLVSGVLSRTGPPGTIVDLLNQGALVPLFDGRILAEYEAVLRRPRFRFPPATVRAMLDNVEFCGVAVSALPLRGLLLPDIADLAFLEVAAAGAADFLVTGNERHFVPVQGRHSVEVVAPRRYVNLLGRS